MITASELQTILEENEKNNSAINLKSLSQSDVQSWLSDFDVSKVRSNIRSSIDGAVVNDMSKTIRINGQMQSLNDIITSHNDDPTQFESAFIIRNDRDIVSYYKGDKKPIFKEEVNSLMMDKRAEIIEGMLNTEIINSAIQNFQK